MARQGGRYIRDKNGKVRLAERTQDHREGNRPRDHKGRPVDVPEVKKAPAVQGGKQ